MSRMKFSGYSGRITSRMFTISCCLVVGLALGLGLRLDTCLWLVSSYAHV